MVAQLASRFSAFLARRTGLCRVDDGPGTTIGRDFEDLVCELDVPNCWVPDTLGAGVVLSHVVIGPMGPELLTLVANSQTRSDESVMEISTGLREQRGDGVVSGLRPVSVEGRGAGRERWDRTSDG